jgi:hypothetical protein
MSRVHRDAYTALIGALLLAGAIWWLLATLNPRR